ncbi:MAG: hypothetical protein MUO76_04890 [Anaerolineaceae bacterium]|nr:hypothetical protein [Anaerolineaceae bacterium]
MPNCQIIDTFPAFQMFWARTRRKSLNDRVEGWLSEYMSQWPELLGVQLGDYASMEMDWRQVALERIFPVLDERLPDMQTAHGHLLEICGSINKKAQDLLAFQSEVYFVIYVGIGCGAGWVTTYQDTPAVLFGLENIAEEGWTQYSTLNGLAAHELGHLAHFYWLDKGGIPRGKGPWWDLYTEGFAQRCEHLILGEETWHMADARDAGNWLDWCRENKTWLAEEYLRSVDAGEAVNRFFGSWYEVQGYKQTGYFLGHELIRSLEGQFSFEEIALLPDWEIRMREVLEKLVS